eukprot:gnl/Spiro4/22651_TR11171_c0_g1_i1.p1 gnl/Spiro4/22651_TR11171_c0_g1~~gnl/Spiro4/22651_TR11171_c0_g1_i1.p1  ORF type:complete len:607 (-),score=109.94 gnl/Spiro4/22651_TR11171_c0_g1_i1:277-2070(-)
MDTELPDGFTLIDLSAQAPPEEKPPEPEPEPEEEELPQGGLAAVPTDGDSDSSDAELRDTDLLDESDEESSWNFRGFVRRSRLLVSLSWPVVATYLCTLSFNFVGLVFVGHLNSRESLAAAALATLFTNITGFSVLIGMSSAIETLAPQSYGAKRYSMVGLFVQRSITVTTFAMIPLFVLWWTAGSLLKLLGQPPDVADLAGTYVRIQILALWPYFVFDAMRKWMQAQHVVHPPIVVSFTAALIHPLVCFLLIVYFDLGLIGASLSSVISNWILFSLMVAVILLRGYYVLTWPGFLWREMFRGWKQILALAIPGAGMLCLEWWCFEINTLLSGLVNIVVLDTFLIMMQLMGVMFVVPLGVGVAVNVLVGNALGAARPNAARTTCIDSAIIFLTVQVSALTMTFFVSPFVAGFFSEDPEILEMFVRFRPFMCLLMLFDGLQGCLSGMLRGIGLQCRGLLINFVGYYVICVSMALAMTFRAPHLGLFIPLSSLLSGTIFTSTCMIVTLVRTDWRAASDAAVKRTSHDSNGRVFPNDNNNNGSTKLDESPDDALDRESSSLHPHSNERDTELAELGAVVRSVRSASSATLSESVGGQPLG